jgi:hypothetical protein
LGNLIHADKPDNFEISSDQWFDYKDLNKKPIRYSLDIFNQLKELEQNKVYTELDNIIIFKYGNHDSFRPDFWETPIT